MGTIRVSDSAVDQVLATADLEVRRLWGVADPDLRALHRGRVEGAVDALLTLGVISIDRANEVRSSIDSAIEHSTN